MKCGIALLSVLLALLLSLPASAQRDSHVFPQVADGWFPDGAFFLSTVTITPWLNDVTCALEFRGLAVDFGGGADSSFTTTLIPADGFLSVRTAGTEPISTGYLTVSCTESVFAEVTYSFFGASGGKIAEATVFSSPPWSDGRIALDGRDGAELALAIANDTDLVRLYDLTLRDSSGNIVSTGTVEVPARSSRATFAGEIMFVPPGQVLMLEIQSADFSDFSAIGFRFTGSVFATVPNN